MNRRFKIVTWLLRLNGALLLLAIVAVFFPTSLMNSIHARLGMGQLPEAPIVEYLTRSLSALYAVHGALTICLTLRMRAAWWIVPYLAGLHICFGMIVTVIDFQADLPIYWSLLEGPPISGFGLLVCLLWNTTKLD